MILPWIKTGVITSDGNLSVSAYKFGPCILLLTSNWNKTFYAPDGAFFHTEEKFIKHMDKLAKGNKNHGTI